RRKLHIGRKEQCRDFIFEHTNNVLFGIRDRHPECHRDIGGWRLPQLHLHFGQRKQVILVGCVGDASMMKILIASMLFAQLISTGSHRRIFPSSAPVATAFVNGCVGSASALTTNCTLSATSGNLLVASSKTQNSSGTGTPVFTTSGISCNWKR